MTPTPPHFLSDAKRYFSSAGGWLLIVFGAVLQALTESLPAIQQAYPGLKHFGLWLAVAGAVYKSILATKEGNQTKQQNSANQNPLTSPPIQPLIGGEVPLLEPDELLRLRNEDNYTEEYEYSVEDYAKIRECAIFGDYGEKARTLLAKLEGLLQIATKEETENTRQSAQDCVGCEEGSGAG